MAKGKLDKQEAFDLNISMQRFHVGSHITWFGNETNWMFCSLEPCYSVNNVLKNLEIDLHHEAMKAT